LRLTEGTVILAAHDFMMERLLGMTLETGFAFLQTRTPGDGRREWMKRCFQKKEKGTERMQYDLFETEICIG
jgi:hypothetical protein